MCLFTLDSGFVRCIWQHLGGQCCPVRGRLTAEWWEFLWW